jgi:superfamily II DNA or RNA helicase
MSDENAATETSTVDAWIVTHRNTVYRHIAHAALHVGQKPAALDGITLRTHQHTAVERIEQAIATHGGALLADAVGLGKTYTALAVANRYDTLHVLAPAALLPMWRRALAAVHQPASSLHSLQSLSRRPLAPCTCHGTCLVIIDEAHHLRTRNTVRYRNAARFTANRKVLLLSATPLHNRPQDLTNLLALFVGTRANALDDDSLAQCIIRRTASHTPLETLPAVREHAPWTLPENPAVLEHLLALPTPLPARDGAAAGALIRLGLLRAWCSSDAALSHTIRTRQLRGEALLHSLAHGRYPSLRELQSFIVGNDAIQLGFPELLAAVHSTETIRCLSTLTTHLDALGRLLQIHIRTSVADPERAAMLRSLIKQDDGDLRRGQQPSEPPVIAFSQFASTVRALHRALSDLAGVASLTATGGRIASGPIARQQLIAQFAPRAHERPPPPSHEHIQLLLTTDLLSEGVNLQDAGRLVHLDLPWTDATRAQRVGRIARMGSPHRTVDVFTMAPPPGIEATLRIRATLERKARLARTLVGADTVTTNKTAPAELAAESAADLATRLDTQLRSWRDLPPDDRANVAPRRRTSARHARACATDRTPVEVAAVHAAQNGWIAVACIDGLPRVFAHLDEAGAVGAADHVTDAHNILSLMRAIDAIDVPNLAAATPDHRRIAQAFADIARWCADARIATLTGPSARAISVAQARALRELAARVAALPAVARVQVAGRLRWVESSLRAAHSVADEEALDAWRRKSAPLPFSDWMNSLPSSVTRNRASHDHECAAIAVPLQTTDRVVALLLLCDDATGVK